MSQLLIRPYRVTDRDDVLRIAADTAFFGDPVETFLDDRQLFCDAVYRIYIDTDWRFNWVACRDTDVVGFLTGWVNSKSLPACWMRSILPLVLGRLLGRRYQIGRRTLRHALMLGYSSLHYGLPHADLALYPAHLHVNVQASARGLGAGRQLLERYLAQLREAKIPGVHLNTTSHNRVACVLYEKLGFHLLASRPTQAWARFIDQPIENRCYGLRLST
jgi:ribosomal protein S18 acetylase RimI-like enzyme